MGLDVYVFFRVLGELLLFLVGAYAADVLQCDGGADYAEHAERVGAGVAGGYLRRVAVGIDAAECLVGRTETRGVGHCAEQRADHHRKVAGVGSVEEDEVAGEHHRDVEHDGRHGKPVERHAAFPEALEEAGADLESYHEHEQDEAEVLQEREDARRGRYAHMPGNDASKQHESNAEGYSPDLNLAKKYARSYDNGIEERNVCHGISVRE